MVGVSVDHRDPASSYLFPPQTEHYHLDWHRFNLKQRLLGHRTLPVEVFEEKICAGDERGCPQQSPEAISSLAGAVLSRDEAPGYPCSSGSLYSAPVGSPGGPALLLSPSDLLWGEGDVLPEPYLCIPGGPEPQTPVSLAHGPRVICRVSDRTILGPWAGPWSHLQSFGEAVR